MLYPVYVHPGDATYSHGAEVPDFPGCFSADDWQELPRRVQEAVEVWCMGEDMDLLAPMAPLAAAFGPRLRGRPWHRLDLRRSRRHFWCKMMSLLMQEAHMRTTLTLDDQLFAKAVSLAQPGIEKSELIRECVKAFIQRQTARRLANLGGLAPEIELAPRRREKTATP